MSKGSKKVELNVTVNNKCKNCKHFKPKGSVLGFCKLNIKMVKGSSVKDCFEFIDEKVINEVIEEIKVVVKEVNDKVDKKSTDRKITRIVIKDGKKEFFYE